MAPPNVDRYVFAKYVANVAQANAYRQPISEVE
jgi:hypothetical protein